MTPEERAEALVRLVVGFSAGDRHVYVGGVRLSADGEFTAEYRERLLRDLPREIARVIREAEADQIPSVFVNEQPVGEERLKAFRSDDAWDSSGLTREYADRRTRQQVAELLSLLDYYRDCVVALASETGYQSGYDAGRKDGFREGVRACETLVLVKRSEASSGSPLRDTAALHELTRDVRALLEGEGRLTR